MKKFLSLTILRKNINKDFLILFLMSVVNLLFLHYQFLYSIGLESSCFKSSPFDNFVACLLDASFFLLIFWILTFRRLRLALAITFAITLIWSFCNIFYSRFFYQYLSWSAIGQAGNMTDGTVTSSIFEGFELLDLYYPLAIAVFCWLYKRSKHRDVKTRSLRSLICVWLCSIVMGIAAHSLYAFHPEMTIWYQYQKTVFTPRLYDSMWPNWTYFHKGFFRKLILEQLTRSTHIDLTDEQIAQIEKEYLNHSLRVTSHTAPENVKNVVFILVESYLAASSDLKVDGKEITPYLNQLRHDSTVYFNGHMRPNVSIGRSSDGQFIYMAGLLPLHAEITVSQAKNDTIIGLPELIRKTHPDMKAWTIIPSNPTLWEQQAMSKSYGFEKLYSALDYQTEMDDKDAGNCLTDEMIFNYASKKDLQNTGPFFSLLLTVSMHLPYDSYFEHGFTLSDSSLPQRYRNYLTNCHYTDMQIGKYLEFLKEQGLYDNSLIVIAADHEPPLRYLDMEDKLPIELPVYIINGGFNKEEAWDGECNQLDVYTTILDIMGIDCQWRGLGHTLLSKDYQNSVTEDKQILSDLILYGNFFKKNIP